eukprot:1866428-Rhodomonas_salina.1
MAQHVPHWAFTPYCQYGSTGQGIAGAHRVLHTAKSTVFPVQSVLGKGGRCLIWAPCGCSGG